MQTKIAKWGNSYAVRLPKHLVDELGLTEESTLTISREGEKLLLQRPSNEEELQRLLADVQPQEAIDWGAPRGNEQW